MTVTGHIPVMVEEVLFWLRPRAEAIYVDCTVGCGGHTLSILEKTAGQVRIIGIDQDGEALEVARQKLIRYVQSVTLVRANFSDLTSILQGQRIERVDGILYDLGVSSLQLDSPERGFSFRYSSPLDMRMDLREEITAAYLVNELSALELKKIFLNFGQERWADRIARFITEERRKNTITSTTDLVQVMARAIPAGVRRKSRIHFATRVFLALRIAINRELEYLAISLDQAFELLASRGRICVISYHSLEDRIVKQKFKETGEENLKILTKKIIRPSGREIEKNPRARSAKLRVAEKICKRK